MEWSVVKQPNGLYARFDDEEAMFTRVNMTKDEMMILLADHVSSFYSRERMNFAEANPYIGYTHQKLWDRCVEIAAAKLGDDYVDEVYNQCSAMPPGKQSSWTERAIANVKKWLSSLPIAFHHYRV